MVSEICDQATCGEVTQWEQEGIKVLERGQIEDYLLAGDVLQCTMSGHYELKHCEGKADELIALRDNHFKISRKLPKKFVDKIIDWGGQWR